MQSGPIQLIAFAFDRVDQFKGQILRELDRLRGHGLIRIIDLRFVMKDVDGSVRALQESDSKLLGTEADELGALLDRMLGFAPVGGAQGDPTEHLEPILSPAGGLGLSLDEIRALAVTLAPGTASALVLVEHAWAIGLGTAIREAGGRMVAQGFLTHDALLAVGRELNAIVEAEVAIERAAALRGAAMLDALTTLAAAEELQRAALAEAITTAVGVEAFRAAVAAEAVRSLVVAGLLAEADASEAIDVLVDAELITRDTVADAATTADAAIAELSQDWARA
jgi:uncharacterized membrane protein